MMWIFAAILSLKTLSLSFLILTSGRAVDATEALQFGLANRVVPPGTALAEAITYAQQLAKHPQLCMQKDRDMVYRY